MFRLQMLAEALRDFSRMLAAVWVYDPRWEGGFAMPHLPRVLKSPQRSYAIEHKIAAGDLCDVYLASAGDRQFVIKAPRVKSAAADSLLEKEFEVLRHLTQTRADEHRLYFSEPVESAVTDGAGSQANVFTWREGHFTAGEIAMRYPEGLDGRHLAWMFKRLLAALGHVHRSGWVHGAVVSPHLLFHAENHGLLLIDWIHAVRIGEPLTLVPAEFKDWYPSECRYRAEPASDIYLAAKSIVCLAGGDPLRNAIPEHVPRPMRSFLEGCLLESPRMRPQDAWELHEELDELLAELYGAPQYVRLSME